MAQKHLKTVSANGFGLWQAELEFVHSLSESDPRPEFNLQVQMPSIRRQARTAIIEAIADHEQKTNETLAQAKTRIRKSLPPLEVIAQNIDGNNVWHGITLGETAAENKK